MYKIGETAVDAGALVIGQVSDVVADYLSDGSEVETELSKENSGVAEEVSTVPNASHTEEPPKETEHNSIKAEEAEEAVEEVPLDISPESSAVVEAPLNVSPEQSTEEPTKEEKPIVEPDTKSDTKPDTKPNESVDKEAPVTEEPKEPVNFVVCCTHGIKTKTTLKSIPLRNNSKWS